MAPNPLQDYQTCIDMGLHQFTSSTPRLLSEYMDRAMRASLVDLNTPTIPAGLLEMFDEFARARQEFRLELLDLISYIGLRIPEIKEEDNLGVRVQEEIKQDIQTMLYGSKEGKQEFEVSKFNFLQERAKIAGKVAEHKETQEENNALLAELNRAQYRTLQLAWRNIAVQRSYIFQRIQQNKEKLAEPRKSGGLSYN